MNFELGKTYIVNVTEKGIIPSMEFDRSKWFNKDYDDLEFLTDEEKEVIVNKALNEIKAEIKQTADEEQKYDKKWAIGLRYAIKIIDKYVKEQKNTYKYLLHGAKSLVKDHPDLVRDIWNCSSCEHTKDECKDCYPELGYKNNKLKRDTEAVKEFVENDAFTKLMESLDDKDIEDAEQFLRDVKAKEQEK